MTPNLPPVMPGNLLPFPAVPEGHSHWEYRGKGYDSTIPCVYAGFFEQFPEDGWRGIPDAPETLRGNVDAHYIEAVRDYKFRNVSCSQCGGEFGPGDHGFSHCADHSKQEPESPKSSGNSGEVESPKPDEGEELSIKVPTGYTFAEINEFVHADVDFEDLQCALLGMASHFDKPTPPKPEDQVCDLPPAGWYCTRESGHEGPCAAVEISSKTPRTDAALIPVHGVATDYVDADFARQLESDLAAARAENDRLTGLVEYSKQHGLIVGRAITTDQPEGYLAHDYREGSTLQRIFLEWSDSIGQDAEIQRLRAALEGAIKVITQVARIDDNLTTGVDDYETRTKAEVDVAEAFLEKHNLPRYEL